MSELPSRIASAERSSLALMERSFQNFEVVGKIAKFSRPADQARLGRVNTFCSAVSLQVLWREIPGLGPLLRLLPGVAIQRRDRNHGPRYYMLEDVLVRHSFVFPFL